jgi:two-component system, sensor histidine kinase YesM
VIFTSKIKHKLHDLPFKYKLIFMLYAIVVPFIFFNCAYLYYTTQRSTTESLSRANLEIIKQINTSLEFMQVDISDISTYVSINDNVNKLLNEKNPDLNSSQLEWEQDNSMRFIMNEIATKSQIKFVALYAENGLSPYYITTDTSVLSSNPDQVKKSPFYREADVTKGAPIWSRVDQNDHGLFEINKSTKIMLSRMIVNYSQVRDIGYLIFGVDESYIQNIIRSAIKEGNEGISVINQSGEILTQSGRISEDIAGYITSHLREKSQTAPEGGSFVDYKDSYIYFSRPNVTGTSIFYVVPKSNMLNSLNDVAAIPIIILVGALLLLLPISFFASAIITKPMGQLCTSMQKFKNGDFTQRVNFEAKDEIGQVAQCYNGMVRNMKELIDTTYVLKLRERESELSSLQAQINPHFLYNTLDSIYWQALTAGNDEIANMIYSLSRIFRLSLNRGQGMTTVEKEKELVYHYLLIQKMRFKEKLQFILEIDEQIYDCIIPKLIIQPFVENAIVHGIEGSDKGGTVKIFGRCEEEQLIFTIEDDGIGMTAKQSESLLQCADGDINTSRSPGGYAVNNVYERLKLKFNEDFLLDIDSEEAKGTTVTIVLPRTDFKL